jgi:phosphatidylglycerophosphatase GEP4
LLGPVVDRNGREVEQKPEEQGRPDVPRALFKVAVDLEQASDSEKASSRVGYAGSDEPPKIVVIGDRLFTDTLLAHRLRLHLGKGKESEDVISIHTTRLPQPQDVRILRWIEERLAGKRLRQGKIDWSRFIMSPDPELSAADARAMVSESVKGWGRFIPVGLRDPPPFTRNPRTWPIPVLLWTGRTVGMVFRMAMRWTAAGIRWAWARTKRRSEAPAAVIPPHGGTVVEDKPKTA